jgi:Xaa-Pro aminopeptidase
MARGAALVSDRLERLQALLPELEVGALLVSHATNVRYLTGFASSNAAIVAGTDRVRLFTDGRYIEAARAVEGIEAALAERDLFGYLGKQLPELAGGTVGFEAEHVTVAQHGRLSSEGAALVPTGKVVEGLRAVKADSELASIRRSAALLNEAFERFARERVTGRTEAELSWWMERTIRELGAEGVSFQPIVASGPNAALPHHHPGERVVGPGETLLLDAGALVDGYCSDCTRTFATGELPPALARAYDVCLDAQLRSLQGVAPAQHGVDVDRIARAILVEHGYEVMHGLGHAVGLEIHENPRLSETSTDTLVAGNVVTVEPGVYLPGVGGVRIEDLVIVTESGPEVLTPMTKDLVVLS